MIDGQTRTCGVIGNPIKHTISPLIHNSLAARCGHNLVYVPFLVEEDKVGSRYIYKANKPFSESYKKAMEIMGTTTETTFFVGDQLFTDVWGAKKVGILTYLVKPIHPKEEIQIVLKRYLEKIVLFFYNRNLNSNL